MLLGAFACGRVDRESDDGNSKCGSPTRDSDALAPEIVRPRPDQNFWHTDPALGGCLARVSDHALSPEETTLQAAVGRQAFSPDGSLVVASSGVVVETSEFRPIAKLRTRRPCGRRMEITSFI